MGVTAVVNINFKKLTENIKDSWISA